MALSYALNWVKDNNLARLTNYGEFLEKFPPTWEAEVVDNSSWSCAHGIERWRSDCGCNGGKPGWNQRWRTPLRQALDLLRDRTAPLAEALARPLLKDLWAARDAYIHVILDRSSDNLDRFFAAHATHPLTSQERITVFELLELQRHTQLMYTSCGWFFDDISGIETVQIIAYAGRVIQLANKLPFCERTPPPSKPTSSTSSPPPKATTPMPATVPTSTAASSTPAASTSKALAPTTPSAPSSAATPTPAPSSASTSTATPTTSSPQAAAASPSAAPPSAPASPRSAKTSASPSSTSATRTSPPPSNATPPTTPPHGKPSSPTPATPSATPTSPSSSASSTATSTPPFYSLTSLFADEQHRILQSILNQTLSEVEGSLIRIYNEHATLLDFLADANVAAPPALAVTAGFAINASLRRSLEADTFDSAEITRLLRRAEVDHVTLDNDLLSYTADKRMKRAMVRLEAALELQGSAQQYPQNLSVLNETLAIAESLRTLPMEINLWQAQNIWNDLLRRSDETYWPREWREGFRKVGIALNISVDDLVIDLGVRAF